MPPERFGAFWKLVRSALRPGGRVFVASLGADAPAEKERRSQGPRDHTTTCRLNDGREFRIVETFHDPAELEGRLAGLGWNVSVPTTDNHLLYGFGGPRS